MGVTFEKLKTISSDTDSPCEDDVPGVFVMLPNGWVHHFSPANHAIRPDIEF